MQGQPVWLASVSFWRGDNPLKPAETRLDRQARTALRMLLADVGNEDHERGFAMPLTFCAHRAATVDEVTAHCDLSRQQPLALAGHAMRILWVSEDCPPALSAMPCDANGTKRDLTLGFPVELPSDCGQCASCRARALYDQTSR